MAPTSLTPEERFLAKVDIAGEDECWLWTATLINSGYGRFWYEGTTVLAHRLAYELWVGDIPEGMTIDHTCHGPDCLDGVECVHRRCVNPRHLEAVTKQVNLLRGNTIVASNAVKTHCMNGHEFTAENTANRRGKTGMYRVCRRCERDRAHQRTTPKVLRISR